ncbi:MAG: hypothetical protein J6K19_02305 [Prevotella sp.]|nr:hypothetical protein [Prevotella sp.]
MEDGIVNKDYVCVVKDNNGVLLIKKIPVDHDTILIEELEAMRDNPNKTIIDMQNHFAEHYPKELHSGKGFSYIYPASYNDAYIGQACYPTFIEYDEYKNKLEEYEKKLRDKYLNSEASSNLLQILKISSEEEYEIEYKKRLDKIKKELAEKKLSYKKHFKAERYIYAFNYYEKVKAIAQDKDSKMFSTEKIGWSDVTFPINEDLSVYMKTNFGYGGASYFFCNIIYKGISILPYSEVVKYSYVKWLDFIRYTRKYRPNRDNWMPALDFAVETANLAKHNAEEFVQVWIVNELEEMMKGLRVIFTSSDANIRKYLELKNETSIGSYNLVRNFNYLDKIEYKVLPQEKIIAFKAEKITGTLYFLDNLKNLKELTDCVNTCIDEIIDMNKKMIPEISQHIDFISKDIDRLQKSLNEAQYNFDRIEKDINEIHNTKIRKLLEQMKKDNPHRYYSEYDAEERYKRENPSFVRLKEEYCKHERRIGELNEDIRLRNRLVFQLQKSMKRINKYLLAL